MARKLLLFFLWGVGVGVGVYAINLGGIDSYMRYKEISQALFYNRFYESVFPSFQEREG